jgi:hypothetical protein
MSLWRHLRAVVFLPFTVTVVVPGLVLWRNGTEIAAWPLALAGGVLIALGLALLTWTIALFVRVGGGRSPRGIPPRGWSSSGPTGTSETR